MARTAARLPDGARITDYISLGVVAKTFGPEKIKRILVETGRQSVRERALPAQVAMYYSIALLAGGAAVVDQTRIQAARGGKVRYKPSSNTAGC